jgi:hypothetical protein
MPYSNSRKPVRRQGEGVDSIIPHLQDSSRADPVGNTDELIGTPAPNSGPSAIPDSAPPEG